jgi:hypothetical protein
MSFRQLWAKMTGLPWGTQVQDDMRIAFDEHSRVTGTPVPVSVERFCSLPSTDPIVQKYAVRYVDGVGCRE